MGKKLIFFFIIYETKKGYFTTKVTRKKEIMAMPMKI